MDNKSLREEISKILVNNSMPTRQVAINEIVALMDLQRKELAEAIIGEINSSCDFCNDRCMDDNINELTSKYLK